MYLDTAPARQEMAVVESSKEASGGDCERRCGGLKREEPLRGVVASAARGVNGSASQTSNVHVAGARAATADDPVVDLVVLSDDQPAPPPLPPRQDTRHKERAGW